MEDLGPNSDCGESESQTDSETGNNIETKVSLQGEIKEKGGMEPPESSVQPSMTKTCDIDIVVQGSSVQRETKDNRNVEQESSGQHDKERISDKAAVQGKIFNSMCTSFVTPSEFLPLSFISF